MTESLSETTDLELDALLTAAASSAWGHRTSRVRARTLVTLADELQRHTDELVAAALPETGLPEARLRGEVTRTAVQLTMFAEEILGGAYLDVVIDRPDPGFVLGPRPDLRRFQVPIGPVLVFAAGNFPFAFSVAGTDTASALAAGCPVIVKAHPGHPRTSMLTASIVADTLAECGAPAGTFAMIKGIEIGVRALRDRRIAAAAFTGSVSGGRALFDIAAARRRPIPFYGELGSLNPVVITHGAATERPDEIAAGFVGSFTLGAGQFCTKPGLLLIPAGTGLIDRITQLANDIPIVRLLTTRTAEALRNRSAEVNGIDGVEVLLAGAEEVLDDSGVPAVGPTLMKVGAAQLLEHGDTLLAETFGPSALIVEYPSEAKLYEVLSELDGTLTVTVHTGSSPSESERAALSRLVPLAASRCGRLVFNGWPTGVAVTPAQNHGGPYPATTAVAHTSVGTAAIRRFIRPIAFQDAPAGLLPVELQEANPLGVPRTVNEAGQSAGWGRGQY